MDRVRQALTGALRLKDLSAEEQDALLDELDADFDDLSDDTRAYFAALGEREGAVGAGTAGKRVERQSSGRLRSVARSR